MNTRLLAQRVLCVFAALMVSLGTVGAETIHVGPDDTADYSTIRAALAAARSGDIIVVSAGTYTGTGACDLVLAGKTVTIQSSDPSDPNVVAATVIDCQAKDGFGHRFIEITPKTGAALTLAGLTIINAADGFSGGGVLCESASLNLTNCIFTNNSVTWWGGAINCQNSDMVIDGCTFNKNASAAMEGGAVLCQNSTLTLTGSTFFANTGTALRLYSSDVTVVGCTFENNTGTAGGAIYSYVSASPATPVGLTVSDCNFVENTCTTSGGAISFSGVQATIDACTFFVNTASQDGGAIYNYLSSPSISNSLFCENTADDLGGAIANQHDSIPDIIHCTFYANVASSGGAVSSRRDSDPLISHCILWNNEAKAGSGVALIRQTSGQTYTTQATVAYCDVEFGEAGAHADAGCTLTWGSGNLDVDPLFIGPWMDDYHLSSDSPCIDTGDPNYDPGDDAVDLDGQPRFYGKTTDMGAYEYQGLGPVYRFWSPSQNRHFYTITAAERDYLINDWPGVWQFEGIGFYAYYQNEASSVVPVYRFWSPALSSHLWTTDEDERDKLIESGPDMWTYEGIVFYAYPTGKAPLGTLPVYRLWSAKLGYHFYTIDESEKDKLLTEYPNVWTLEGIAFYTYLTAYNPVETTSYTFTGDSENAYYTMTLAACVDGQAIRIDAPEATFDVTGASMQISADFADEVLALKALQIESELIEHTATIQEKGVSDIAIPFSISAQATFQSQTARGPFAIDLPTGTFADYLKAPESWPAEGETFTCNGQITLGGKTSTFELTVDATQFDLESYGTFDSWDQSEDGIAATVPLTFQWQRSDVQDLLVETTVDGHTVQLYATWTYVGTDGTWQGKTLE